MAGYKVDRGVPFLSDDSGKVIGYIADDGKEYALDGSLLDRDNLDPIAAINERLDSLGVSAYAQSAVPVILLPSGSFTATDGTFLLGTALSSVPNGSTPLGGNAYVYLPSAGGLSAGLYEATFSTTTVGVILGVTTTVSAWTQSTGIVTLASIPVAANALGKNGMVDVEISTSNNNSAGSKTLRVGLNATTGAISAATTTTTGMRCSLKVQNRGRVDRQFSSSGSGSFGVMPAGSTSSVDTSAAWAINITAQLATATDWISLDAFSAIIVKSA